MCSSLFNEQCNQWKQSPTTQATRLPKMVKYGATAACGFWNLHWTKMDTGLYNCVQIENNTGGMSTDLWHRRIYQTQRTNDVLTTLIVFAMTTDSAIYAGQLTEKTIPTLYWDTALYDLQKTYGTLDGRCLARGLHVDSKKYFMQLRTVVSFTSFVVIGYHIILTVHQSYISKIVNLFHTVQPDGQNTPRDGKHDGLWMASAEPKPFLNTMTPKDTDACSTSSADTSSNAKHSTKFSYSKNFYCSCHLLSSCHFCPWCQHYEPNNFYDVLYHRVV